MDRSYLSHAEVIAASRQFVCIRLATYENATEAKFLASICKTRSGELENTVFAILAPDGKKKLIQASRSPRHLFADASDLAKTMNWVAGQYKKDPGKSQAVPPLPTVANVRLALDVAACDNQPLIVLCGASEKLREQLRRLAWTDAFVGKFVFASVSSTKDLSAVSGVDEKSGLIAVQPDQFGQKGKVLVQIGKDAPEDTIARFLKDSASRYQPVAKSFKSHVQQGRLQGVFWETVVPVTDPEELMARKKSAPPK